MNYQNPTMEEFVRLWLVTVKEGGGRQDFIAQVGMTPRQVISRRRVLKMKGVSLPEFPAHSKYEIDKLQAIIDEAAHDPAYRRHPR